MPVITDYGGLVAALRDRRVELGMAQLELDRRAGLPDGYTGKIESWKGSEDARRLGCMSLTYMLGALHLGLTTVPLADSKPNGNDNPGIFAAANKRKRGPCRALRMEIIRKSASKGGKAWASKLTKRERSEIARKVALKRWRKIPVKRRAAVMEKATKAAQAARHKRAKALPSQSP